MVDLREANLPGRIALQLDVGAKQYEQIWLCHHAFRYLGVDQVEGDVIGRKFIPLRHLGQGLRKINERRSPVSFRQQKNRQVTCDKGQLQPG